MPYFAPDAPIPITSCAPRFAEMNASPVTHGGQRPAGEEEVGARAHHALERQADAEHDGEVDGHDRVVDRREVSDRISFHVTVW